MSFLPVASLPNLWPTVCKCWSGSAVLATVCHTLATLRHTMPQSGSGRRRTNSTLPQSSRSIKVFQIAWFKLSLKSFLFPIAKFPCSCCMKSLWVTFVFLPGESTEIKDRIFFLKWFLVKWYVEAIGSYVNAKLVDHWVICLSSVDYLVISTLIEETCLSLPWVGLVYQRVGSSKLNSEIPRVFRRM